MHARQQLSPVAMSLGLHALILGAMATITLTTEEYIPDMVLDSVLAEERTQEEFVQDIQEPTEVAESLNFVAGSISDASGGSSGPMSNQTKIEDQEVIRDPQIEIKVGDFNLQGVDTLSNDLGELEVTGEVGAVVEGYGAALDQLTRELVRMMRGSKLMVVWLFDESGSMKDDQEDLKKRMYTVYEELKLVDRDPRRAGAAVKRGPSADDILLTSITSYGGSWHVHTPQPSSRPEELMAAIDRIPVDQSGDEAMCTAIFQALKKYEGVRRSKRKLVLIVVSDESGDDGTQVEEVLQAAKSARAPIYFLGREATFGSLYAHVKWRQPETGRLFYLPIRRGPETPFAELLQWDGFRRRRDSHMSGFGPYEQVRLAKETGGIFFQLPNEQEDLNDLDNRKFEMLAMREYVPNLESRREYAVERDRSEFRKAIWDVISLLNPYDPRNKALELPDYEYFSLNWAESSTAVMKRLQQITLLLAATTEAQERLESVRSLRAQEASVRWRASYDLMTAQLYAYRVRLFEYGIALHQFGQDMPQRIKNPKSNRWSIRVGVSKLVLPTEAQEKILKVTAEDLQKAHEDALRRLALVSEEHPGTPWARRAEYERNRNFGASFNEHYFPPRTPGPRKPRPKPTPPPKL